MKKATIVLLLWVVMLPATAAQAEPCEPFSIAVLGDSRGGLFDAFTGNLRSIYQSDPRPIGVFNTGDITPDGAPDQWMDHHQALAEAVPDTTDPPDPSGIPRQSAFVTEMTGLVWPGGERIRYVPIMGNHDWNDGSASYETLNLFFPWLADLGADGEVGSNGADGVYYYVTNANAVFIVLDSEHPSDPQTSWLESVLQRPELANKWKIVFFHHPPFPCGGGKNPFDDGLPWVRLFETYQVPLVFVAHTHTTERTCRMIDGACVPDNEFGVVYLNSSGAGVGTRSVDTSITDTVSNGGDSIDYDCSEILEFAEARHHFYHITIEGGVLRGNGYYDDQAETNAAPFDSFTLTDSGSADCDPLDDPTDDDPGDNGASDSPADDGFGNGDDDPRIAGDLIGGCGIGSGGHTGAPLFAMGFAGLLLARRRRRRHSLKTVAIGIGTSPARRGGTTMTG